MPTVLPPPIPSIHPVGIRTNRRIYIQNLVNLLHASLTKGDVDRAERSWAILCRCKEIDWRKTWKLALAVFDLVELGDRPTQIDILGSHNDRDTSVSGTDHQGSEFTEDGNMDSRSHTSRARPPQHGSSPSIETHTTSQTRHRSSEPELRRDRIPRDPVQSHANKVLFLRRLLVSVPAGQRPEVLLNLVLALVKGVVVSRAARDGLVPMGSWRGSASYLRREQRQGCEKALDELELYLPSHPYNLSPSLSLYAGLTSFYLSQPDSEVQSPLIGRSVRSRATRVARRDETESDPDDTDSEPGSFARGGWPSSSVPSDQTDARRRKKRKRTKLALGPGSGDARTTEGQPVRGKDTGQKDIRGASSSDEDPASVADSAGTSFAEIDGWDKTRLRTSLAYFNKSKELLLSQQNMDRLSSNAGCATRDTPSMGAGDPSERDENADGDEMTDVWIRRIRRMLGEGADRDGLDDGRASPRAHFGGSIASAGKLAPAVETSKTHDFKPGDEKAYRGHLNSEEEGGSSDHEKGNDEDDSEAETSDRTRSPRSSPTPTRGGRSDRFGHQASPQVGRPGMSSAGSKSEMDIDSDTGDDKDEEHVKDHDDESDDDQGDDEEDGKSDYSDAMSIG